MSAPTDVPRNPPEHAPLLRTTAAKAWAAALYSAVLAFLSSLLTALGGADTGFDSITAGQWLTAVIAALVAFGGAAGLTYYVPNKPR
ncbi:hypothetical protein GCM10027451_29830 [Geodermatophilus aquaeductus]|jgi:hypothetical protein|uniref:Uncharacterized protein n=1 Tax=Geodermatophilus aquaeductus TaxID=1564161 RepID=A0A521FUD9_9ACTN|nr:hypothetical protein [Geodermatophilus aquaeductus]SMO99787.1 hypothetical protein SAMN06273567_11917 [Geodermatophilus aquaeductus]